MNTFFDLKISLVWTGWGLLFIMSSAYFRWVMSLFSVLLCELSHSRLALLCGYTSNEDTPKMILLYTKNRCLWSPCFQYMWCVNYMKSIRLKVNRKILLPVLFICGRLLFVHALRKIKICVFPELSESLVELNHWWTFIWTLDLLWTVANLGNVMSIALIDIFF